MSICKCYIQLKITTAVFFVFLGDTAVINLLSLCKIYDMSKVVYWYVWYLNWTDNESDFSQIEKKEPDY